jgi:SAM-dependent methyltransferase
MQAQMLADYVRSAENSIGVPAGQALEMFWRFHPRFRFFKTLPAGAALLDVGAESGALSGWRLWGDPARADIRLFGVDLGMGEHAGAYERWAVCDLDREFPDFGVAFDGAMLAQVLCQLARPQDTLAWVAQSLAPGGVAYIEWQSPDASRLPRRSDLKAQDIDVVILNPSDDAANRNAFTLPEMAAMTAQAGLKMIDCGQVRLGPVADALVQEAHAAADIASVTFALWGRLGASLYLVAEKG